MPPTEQPNLARRESDGVVLKAIGHIDVKDESKGEIEAVIATLNAVDREGDVILPTAIKSGSKVVLSSYGHNTVGSLFGDGGHMPAGKGMIVIIENKAVFQGNVFMDMQLGRDTLALLKNMGADQEWSFGFRVIGSEVPDEDWRKKGAERILTKLDCFEVSPVLIGAGVGTRTLSAKEAADRDEAARKRAEEEAAEAARAEEEQKAADAELKRLTEAAMSTYHESQRQLRNMRLIR